MQDVSECLGNFNLTVFGEIERSSAIRSTTKTFIFTQECNKSMRLLGYPNMLSDHGVKGG